MRRDRPITWRSALLWLVPLALLAAGSDLALYAFVSDHYAQHGHFGVRVDLAAAALGFRALTVYGCVAVLMEVRKGRGGRQAVKPVDAAGKNREARRRS